jgi:glycyl-tRNA synthetase beta chain
MAIARAIGKQLGSEELAMHADRAALLAKADLLTDMVGEFPELQGIMGRYYATHDGENSLVAEAIEDHYKPRFSGDELPRSDVGVCVALADKMETLVGLFGIGQIPTGDKDPFALRRHALGVLRILIEKSLPLSLFDLVNMSFSAFPKSMLGDVHTDVETFMFERLGGMLREQGFSANEVDAVLSMRPVQISLVPKQLSAVRAFAALPEAPALAAANKRVANILRKVEGKVPVAIFEARFQEAAETALLEAMVQIKPQADAAFESGDYTTSLQTLAVLKTPVDNFFDSVMVNVDDPALRNNRLALLNQLHMTMNRVADLSKLAV